MMRQTVCLVQWCDPSGATVSLPLFSQLVTHWVDGRACGHHSWITAALPTLRQGMPFSHTPTRGQHKKSGTAKGQVKLFVALQQAVEQFVAPAFRRIFRASLTKRNSRPIKGAEACLQFLSFLFAHSGHKFPRQQLQWKSMFMISLYSKKSCGRLRAKLIVHQTDTSQSIFPSLFGRKRMPLMLIKKIDCSLICLGLRFLAYYHTHLKVKHLLHPRRQWGGF